MARPQSGELQIPNLISNASAEAICSSFKLPQRVQAVLQFALNDIILTIGCMMPALKTQPDRRIFLRRLKSVLSAIKKARGLLLTLAPGLVETDSEFGPVTFVVSSFPIQAPRSLVSSESAGVNPWLLCQTQRSMERNPLTSVPTFLYPAENVLAMYLEICRSWGKSKGGRPPFILRRGLICRLADIWEALRRRASSGPNSDFVKFVSHVFKDIGWPGDDDDGNSLPAAVAAALKFRAAERRSVTPD